MKPDFGIAGRLSLKQVGSSWDRRHHIVPAGVSHGFADPGKRRRLRRLLSSYLEMDIHRVYEPFFRYFRTKRMRTFVGRFGVTEETRILDVGGSSFNWTLIDVKPRVVLLNLDQGDVIGDGTRLPFLDGSFDIVFSNSVIEHLRNRDAQMQFASEVRRVGKCFFVQTPHRYFPIEPHYLTPLIHFLPRRLRVRAIRFSVRGLLTKPSREDCQRMVDEIVLLNRGEMEALFGPTVRVERFLGLPKALIAYCNPPVSDHE